MSSKKNLNLELGKAPKQSPQDQLDQKGLQNQQGRSNRQGQKSQQGPQSPQNQQSRPDQEDQQSRPNRQGQQETFWEKRKKPPSLWQSFEDLSLSEVELQQLSSEEFKSSPLRKQRVQVPQTEGQGQASMQGQAQASMQGQTQAHVQGQARAQVQMQTQARVEQGMGEELDPMDRREFLKLMAASMALVSTSCLRRPVQKIVPYVEQKEETVLGVANHYASSWVDVSGLQAYGLLVKSHDGRPIKVEGNPHSPGHGSALSARAQAHLLKPLRP